jgi:hypothetical protein
MGDARDREWVRTLDEVEDAVRRCLAVLDRYESKFAELLGDRAPQALSRPAAADRPLPEWDDRLAKARGQADEVERLLAEQEAVWGRWREALSEWRRSVEQPPGAAADPVG